MRYNSGQTLKTNSGSNEKKNLVVVIDNNNKLMILCDNYGYDVDNNILTVMTDGRIVASFFREKIIGYFEKL